MFWRRSLEAASCLSRKNPTTYDLSGLKYTSFMPPWPIILLMYSTGLPSVALIRTMSLIC